MSRSARVRAPRALFERQGNLLVWTFGRESEVPRALLGVGDDLGEPAVQVAASCRRRLRVGGRREQRMREDNCPAVTLEEVGLERGRKE